MMRVETVHRPSNLVAGADYRAININGQPPQTPVAGNLVVEGNSLLIRPVPQAKAWVNSFSHFTTVRPPECAPDHTAGE